MGRGRIIVLPPLFTAPSRAQPQRVQKYSDALTCAHGEAYLFSATQLGDVFGRKIHAFLHLPKALFASFFRLLLPVTAIE